MSSIDKFIKAYCKEISSEEPEKSDKTKCRVCGKKYTKQQKYSHMKSDEHTRAYNKIYRSIQSLFEE